MNSIFVQSKPYSFHQKYFMCILYISLFLSIFCLYFCYTMKFRAYVNCKTFILTILSLLKYVYKCSFCYILISFYFSLTNTLYTPLILLWFCSSIQSTTYAGTCMCMFSVRLYVWFCICVRYSTCVDEIINN